MPCPCHLKSFEVAVVPFAFFHPGPAVADIVEAIWDVDLPDANFTRSIAFKVLPAISPTLCVHYRMPTGSDQRVNPGHASQRLTGVQTRAVTMRPAGPIGAVIIRLKPETAFRLMGGGMMSAFTDANIKLSDVFSATQTALLAEWLAEAPDAATRVERIQTFLLQHLRDDAPDTVAFQAVSWLRQDPTLSVRRLASSLDISERQLSRRFYAMVGSNIKQFARVARLGRVVAARRRGAGWADIAHGCGFNDQAHMIHDFKSMVRSTPKTFFDAALAAEYREVNASLAMSGFCNTFVM
jgi:AraC-like DNA-binding protein